MSKKQRVIIALCGCVAIGFALGIVQEVTGVSIEGSQVGLLVYKVLGLLMGAAVYRIMMWARGATE